MLELLITVLLCLGRNGEDDSLSKMKEAEEALEAKNKVLFLPKLP